MPENGEPVEPAITSPRSSARADKLIVRHAREPRRRRARIADRDAGDPHRARQGQPDVHRRREFPLPHEYRFLPLAGWCSEAPDDLDERTLVFLDCGNLERNPAEALRRAPGAHILNIDHHHDNTRFGTVNLVVPEASCTAEIVWDLMHALGVSPRCTIAEALYVGLMTDTGRFMYENTGARAHLMAAELIEAGVDLHAIYRRVYEGVPYGKLALLARGLANVERYDDGRAHRQRAAAPRTSASPRPRRATRRASIDHLRAVEGTSVARSCATASAGRPRRYARSRCAPATTASTCPRSPAPRGAAGIARRPGSRPRCPGRTWSRSCAPRSRSSSPRCRERRRRPVRQAGRDHLARRRGSIRRRAREGVKVGHAGTLDPFATGLLLGARRPRVRAPSVSSWRWGSGMKRRRASARCRARAIPRGRSLRRG